MLGFQTKTYPAKRRKELQPTRSTEDTIQDKRPLGKAFLHLFFKWNVGKSNKIKKTFIFIKISIGLLKFTFKHLELEATSMSIWTEEFLTYRFLEKLIISNILEFNRVILILSWNTSQTTIPILGLSIKMSITWKDVKL